MASKRVTLKWRKVKGEWRAGPFAIEIRTSDFANWPSFCAVFFHDKWLMDVGTEAEAKRACETLAARILGAMKGSQ